MERYHLDDIIVEKKHNMKLYLSMIKVSTVIIVKHISKSHLFPGFFASTQQPRKS